MKTIWKFPLAGGQQKHRISMPKGAKVLTAQLQNNDITLWAEVNDNKEKETRVFEVYGTGHEMNEYDLDYIGTVQDNSGLVWHVYENK
jgi:hypothetical protein